MGLHSLHNGLLVPIIVPFLSAYLYLIVRHKQPGLSRLLWASPVMCAQTFLPWTFDQKTEPVFLAVAFCIVTWLGIFRTSTFCAGRGVLTSAWAGSSLLRFHLALTLPLQLGPPMMSCQALKGEDSRISRPSVMKSKLLINPGTLIAQTTFKILLFSLVQKAFTIPGVPAIAKDAIFSVGLFLFVTVIMETGSAFLMTFFNVEIQPHFNQPYIAESFQSFWSKRWNLTISSCLRESIYEPVLELLLPELGEGKFQKADFNSARLKAMFASFLLSGIMHEVAVFYISSRVTGEMLAFFLLHFLFICAELQLKQHGVLRKIPGTLYRMLVVGITLVTAHMLFFASVHTTGITHCAIMQVQSWFQR